MPNLFKNIPDKLTDELIQILAEGGDLRIERIVSEGHTTPEDSWYDQDQNEWVVVLQGAAQLRFADQSQLHHLQAGDHVLIPAHVRHRVEWTQPDTQTIWLAVFYGP